MFFCLASNQTGIHGHHLKWTMALSCTTVWLEIQNELIQDNHKHGNMLLPPDSVIIISNEEKY